MLLLLVSCSIYRFAQALYFRLPIRYRIRPPPSLLAALYIVTRWRGPFRLPIRYRIRAPPSC